MNLNFFKAIFNKKLSIKEDITYQVNDIVQVIKSIPKLDVLPGDSYSVTEVSEDSKFIKINHNLGTRFDIFLPIENFRLASPVKNKKFKH